MDALSIAVSVIGAWFNDTGHNPVGWFTFNIYRLTKGDGWLVSSTQSTIVLDKWMAAA